MPSCPGTQAGLASAAGEQAPDILSCHISFRPCFFSSWPSRGWGGGGRWQVLIYISQVWFSSLALGQDVG